MGHLSFAPCASRRFNPSIRPCLSPRSGISAPGLRALKGQPGGHVDPDNRSGAWNETHPLVLAVEQLIHRDGRGALLPDVRGAGGIPLTAGQEIQLEMSGS